MDWQWIEQHGKPKVVVIRNFLGEILVIADGDVSDEEADDLLVKALRQVRKELRKARHEQRKQANPASVAVADHRVD